MPDESIIVPIDIVETEAMASLKNVEKSAGITVAKIENDFSGLKAVPPIAITADGSQVVKTMAQLKSELAGFRSQLKGEMGAAEFNRLNQSIAQTKAQMVALRSAGSGFNATLAGAGTALRQLPASSNAATQSMINLGRVVQDAPFGFLGIANNLNPLLESFQRLKATTGSTGGALKAMGSSLMGAGGLGFALSVVSSLLIVFGDKIFGAGKKAKASKEEFERVKEVIKSLAGTLSERSSVAASGAAEELAKISVLVPAIQDQTKSYKERNNALNSLKAINKNYFGDLTLEANSLATLTGKVNEYSKALINAEIVKAFSADIAKSSVETAKALNGFNKLGNEIDGINRRLKEVPQFIDKQSLKGDIVQQQNTEYTKLTKRLSEANKEYAQQVSLIGELKTASLISNEGLKTALQESFKFKPLEGAAVDLKNETDNILARARQFVKEFGDVLILPDLEESFFKTKETVLKEAQKMFADLKAGKITLRMPVSVVPEFLPVPGESDPSERFFAELKKRFQEPFVIDPTINIAVFNEKMKAQLDKALKSGDFRGALDLIDVDTSNEAFDGLDEHVKTSASLINETLTPAFDGLFDSILKGEDPLKAFFNSIIQSINQVIKRLIAAAIQAAILSAISGGTTSFGSAFGKLFGGGGGIANFGNRVGFAGGGSMAAIQVYGQLRGSDIYLSGVGGGRQVGRAGG